jgi:hypothetical protein
MLIESLIETSREKGFIVRNPIEIPTRIKQLGLPFDLLRFYELCNGIVFSGENFDYVFEISTISDFLSYREAESDPFYCKNKIISDSWYYFCTEAENKIAIDIHPLRSGRCYEASWAMDIGVIATSFTEMVSLILKNEGGYPAWYASDFKYCADPCVW